MQLERRGALFAAFSLGALKVTALSDGYADMRPDCLKGRNSGLAKLTGGKLRLDVNAFLIQAADATLLIDCGSADVWHATAGRIYDAFDEAEISRQTVTAVALTHTHVDHLSGLVMPDGGPAFPAARAIYVPENELPLFAAEARLGALASLVRPAKSGDRIGRHVTVEGAFGHEIGHSALLVQSGADKLLVWGDVVHAPSVQFAHPEVTWEFDADQDEARRTRMKLLDRVARERLPVAGAHLPFPGIGHVMTRGDGYEFTPLL